MKALLAVGLLLLPPAPPARILFIGNSLTYQNNLPGMVCQLAQSAGRPLACESVAKPDYGLEEHWRDGEARKAIAAGRWDIVILQQGPSALPESRRVLVDYTRRFDAEIKKAGARTALYMVWPSRQRRGDAEAVSQSYRAAAGAVHATVLPVGDAWRAAWAIDRDLPLYGADNFHPSGAGTYLAALVIYHHLIGEPAPATPVLGGALAQAGILQQVARQSRSGVQYNPAPSPRRYSVDASMPRPELSTTSATAVTRAIVLGTVAALVVVGALGVMGYRSTVNAAIAQHSTQQLAMMRTAAAGVHGEVRGLSALLRQFNSMPSVQNLDVPYLSQRIAAAFGGTANGVVRYVVRIDAAGRLFYWTPDGTLIANATPVVRDPVRWQWNSDPVNRAQVGIGPAWWLPGAPEQLRVLAMPVWRTAPSGERPNPSNDFNGMVGLAIDLSRLVDIYLGPAIAELADDQLVAGLATPDFSMRMGPGERRMSTAFGDPHQHDEPQGVVMLSDGDGRRIHTWARLAAADQSWLVASSSQYDRVAAQIQRGAAGQLVLMAVLMVALPLLGWFLHRREQRTREGQRQLERQLAESQKMEAIGKLAGGVAHDFNNMLTAILGYSSLIVEDAPADSPVKEQAGQIRRAAESAGALTQKLLAFSRRQVLQTNHFDFTALLDGLLQLVRRVIGADIIVTSQTEPGLWPVMADPAQVEQSIVNLAINARDAMPGGGTLQIAARNAPRPNGERRADGDVRPGDYVQIVVSDTGCGMDEATRARMFEPFFTTKPPGQGTGLGLSTVYGFVRQCGGYLGVTSAPGLGTAIELLLPRAPNLAPAGPVPTPTPISAAPEKSRETVLVVEDEPAVRELAVATLRRGGYHVLAAAGGAEALQVAGAFDGPIHVLLTDVVMPGLKGPELAARIRAARPSVRVLLMSGYAADVVTRADLENATLLAKPFSPAQLIRALRGVLDGPLSPNPLPKG